MVRHSGCCICLPWSWPRCLPPGPGGSRRSGGGLPEQPSRGQYIHTNRYTERKHVTQIHGIQILYTPHKHSYIHTCTYLYTIPRIEIIKCNNLSMYVCITMCFPLHCPGPGYWLLSRPVVPPPQSDHWKQLLSGESTHPTRQENGT